MASRGLTTSRRLKSVAFRILSAVRLRCRGGLLGGEQSWFLPTENTEDSSYNRGVCCCFRFGGDLWGRVR